jgi:GTP 3',8-cyclase
VSASAAPPLVDRYGRVVRDLRVSVTDRCNFRCSYCMPPEGLPWLAPPKLLSFEEITRVVGLLVQCGVQSVKLTGGEPLLRGDLPRLVAMLRETAPTLDMSLTTNGFLLERHARALADAGLDRVSVSCDSLVAHRFEKLTLRDGLARVRAGLMAAAACDLRPIKINTVVIRGENEDEAVDFATLARETGYEVRFIEYMPLDAHGRWQSEHVVPGEELLASIESTYPLVARPGRGAEPATVFDFADGAPGGVGVISSVSAPFCESCDRLRLTADGQLRACLFSIEETDLRETMRSGGSDEDLLTLVRTCVAGKWAGHKINDPDFARPARSMSMIGG